ncbi:hypothetical protein GGR57DRAFT_506745 [Xylariaceae sp. FL1272]|nr:hypothetical protein GGR57DRAFT_506745 [Xylariaceae sp. FL1272]
MKAILVLISSALAVGQVTSLPSGDFSVDPPKETQTVPSDKFRNPHFAPFPPFPLFPPRPFLPVPHNITVTETITTTLTSQSNGTTFSTIVVPHQSTTNSTTTTKTRHPPFHGRPPFFGKPRPPFAETNTTTASLPHETEKSADVWCYGLGICSPTTTSTAVETPSIAGRDSTTPPWFDSSSSSSTADETSSTPRWWWFDGKPFPYPTFSSSSSSTADETSSTSTTDETSSTSTTDEASSTPPFFTRPWPAPSGPAPSWPAPPPPDSSSTAPPAAVKRSIKPPSGRPFPHSPHDKPLGPPEARADSNSTAAACQTRVRTQT